MKIKEKLIRIIRVAVLTFTLMISTITVIGLLFGDQLVGTSSFYTRSGLSFITLLEVLLFSGVISVVSYLFSSDFLVTRVRVLYLTIIRLFVTLLLTSGFIYIFEWFAVENPAAWTTFILLFILCFLIVTVVSVIFIKRKDREYAHVLNEYKMRARDTHASR